MNLREAYARTGRASLAWDEETHAERPVDRVAAAGCCDELGIALWVAKNEGSASATVRAFGALKSRFKQRYKAESWDTANRLIGQAMLEYLKPQCHTCDGRGTMRLDNGVAIVCKTCDGSAVKRYSDSERARLISISLRHLIALQHKFDWVQDMIGKLDRQANAVMVVQLERTK